MTDLSVVIVNYNSGDCLSACLQTVLSELVVRQLVVVDNASTDSSTTLLHDWATREPRLQVVENSENRGFAAACNQGLRLADTDLLLLLNPDCTTRPGALSRVCEVLSQYPAAGMAGCMIRNPDGSEQRGCRRHIPTVKRVLARFARLDQLCSSGETSGFELHREFIPDRPVEVEAISGAFMCVRRAALERVGLLDEGYFMHAEDLDWCLRFSQAGWRILFVPDAEVIHEKGVSSRSNVLAVHWQMHRSMVRFYRKFQAAENNVLLNVCVTVAIWVRYLLMLPVILMRALLYLTSVRRAG